MLTGLGSVTILCVDSVYRPAIGHTWSWHKGGNPRIVRPSVHPPICLWFPFIRFHTHEVRMLHYVTSRTVSQRCPSVKLTRSKPLGSCYFFFLIVFSETILHFLLLQASSVIPASNEQPCYFEPFCVPSLCLL